MIILPGLFIAWIWPALEPWGRANPAGAAACALGIGVMVAMMVGLVLWNNALGRRAVEGRRNITM
jgi:hypothetical protein